MAVTRSEFDRMQRDEFRSMVRDYAVYRGRMRALRCVFGTIVGALCGVAVAAIVQAVV